jgi:hypothetical protein
MKKVIILTQEQADVINGKHFLSSNLDSHKFLVMNDSENNLIVIEEEVDMCDLDEFKWLKEMPRSEYKWKEVILDNSGSL